MDNINPNAINSAIAKIKLHGPSRVLVEPDYAVPCKKAREEYGINPDVIFIREDGWSLGAPKSLEQDAVKMWTWVAFISKPNTEVFPMTVYEEFVENGRIH